ncbi:uncharacterized protein LOC105169180 isoform X1 [Sesamum indicum]|uniref:Uncharacterized protein LOC105169180 isoform X1 n=1 Tax=Sesamum indicum TaxID=4182 RepID=A0A6I9TVS2_SESIN|nr:uncharacterized protein LOC105169180 isoform X1 [Sesamum indicum]XP_020552155.1 uncharacterized protein LOC105169180 isoform X1 [Sesamum indicum]
MEDIFQVFGDMMRSGPLNFQESQEPVQINHQQAPDSYSYGSFSFNQQKIPDAFSFGVDGIQQFGQPVMLLDGNKDEGMNQFAGNNQSPNGQCGPNRLPEGSIEKTEQVWQRIRWTDEMVRILIAAVSYVGDDVSSDCPIKGKWRAISNIMVERGYTVSPQQCEDKFNDLNKKFKRLNDLLGRNISCDVVENPALMESMNISEEAKEEVRKILTCKQLFYQEMCSYHNKNRKFLAHDVPLQQSVQSALKGKAKCDDQNVILSMPAKRQKHGEDNGVPSWADTHPPGKELTDLINVPPEVIEGQQELSQWMISRSLQLEEKKLQIQNQMLELEKRKFEWLKFCQQEDRELHKMRLENEVMKLENERLAFELKCRERSYARD